MRWERHYSAEEVPRSCGALIWTTVNSSVGVIIEETFPISGSGRYALTFLRDDAVGLGLARWLVETLVDSVRASRFGLLPGRFT